MNNVAETILEQLGGSRFRAMTGAHSFVGGARDLTFALPAGAAHGRISKVRVELTPDDLYKVVFYRKRQLTLDPVAVRESIDCGRLRSVFTGVTGLLTQL
jgi:hypothetical protein